MITLNADNINIAREIASYIEQIHGGVITAPDLSTRFHLHPSDIRGIINLCRTMGLPVCSNARGYYWSTNPSDIQNTIDHIELRIAKQKEAVNGLKEAMGVVQ